MCRRIQETVGLGCRCYEGKRIHPGIVFVYEKLALTVPGMETKEEFPPDSNTRIRKSTKQSQNAQVSLRVLGISTHSSQGSELFHERLQFRNIDLFVKVS